MRKLFCWHRWGDERDINVYPTFSPGSFGTYQVCCKCGGFRLIGPVGGDRDDLERRLQKMWEVKRERLQRVIDKAESRGNEEEK